MKRIFIFSFLLVLAACSARPIKQVPAEVYATKKVDFFAAGHTQAVFKVVGSLNDDWLEGVLIVKKIGEDDFDVAVMTAGAYRVLQATLTPQGVAYRYLFKDADTALVRGRINQFLNILLLDPGIYQRVRHQGEQLLIAYKSPSATVHMMYQAGAVYPFAAKTITLLNTADLAYADYAPADASGSVHVPHQLTYQDGKIELALELIRLK